MLFLFYIFMVIDTLPVTYSKFDIISTFCISTLVGVCGIIKYNQISTYNKKLINSINAPERKNYDKVYVLGTLTVMGFASGIVTIKKSHS